MIRRVAIGVATALMVGALAGSSFSEPFFVEMRDGTFKRCGNLDFKRGRGEWRLRGCEPMAALFVPPPLETPQPTPRPTSTVRPVPTATEFCAGGTIEWDPVTGQTRCIRTR